MKKSYKIRLFAAAILAFGALLAKSATAQDFYKITYSGSLLSSNISDKLSKELSDPEMREAFFELIGQYRTEYALYVDVKNNTSLFVEEKEIPLDGPPPFKYSQALVAGDAYYFEDLFRAEAFKVAGKKAEMRWEISNQTQKIKNFTCRKAVLKNDPYNTVVWYTDDMPLSVGPGLSFGLPGLVVLCENDYFACTIDKVTAQPIPAEIQRKMSASPGQKAISLAEYHKKVSPLLSAMADEKIVDP